MVFELINLGIKLLYTKSGTSATFELPTSVLPALPIVYFGNSLCVVPEFQLPEYERGSVQTQAAIHSQAAKVVYANKIFHS